MACFICGIPDSEARMFDVISDSGLVKVCSRCSTEVDLPIIRKAEDVKTKGEEFSVKKMKEYAGLSTTSEKLTTKDVLKAKAADDLNRARKVSGINVSTSSVTFRDLVESKFETNRKQHNSREDLITNYHWDIMKARRAKRISKEKLAKDLNISLDVARKIERGVYDFNGNELLERLEVYLGLSLIKEEFRNKNKKGGIMGISDNLTIADLNEIKQKVAEDNNPYWRRVMGKFFSKKDDIEEVLEEIGQDVTIEEDLMPTDEEMQAPTEVIVEEEGDNNLVLDSESKVVDEENQASDSNDEGAEKKEIVKASKKRDLTPNEINDLIFGAKNKQ